MSTNLSQKLQRKSARAAAKRSAVLATKVAVSRKKGSHPSEETEWVIRKELSPGSNTFPLSHYGAMKTGAADENYLSTEILRWDSAVSSDGSGTYATVTSNSPVQAQNWTSYADVFDAYRILAFKVVYTSAWTVNCTFLPFESCFDRSDSVALTGYGLGTRFTSFKRVSGQKSFTQVIGMSGPDEAEFISTSAPAANTWFKTYTTGNTASFTMGRLAVELLVQFRGLGIN